MRLAPNCSTTDPALTVDPPDMANPRCPPTRSPYTVAAARHRNAEPGAAAQAPAPGSCVRAIILSPATERERWIESELVRARAMVQTAYSVRQILMALCEDPPPRPQVLVIDLGTLGPGEIKQLHQIRERGWFGTVVAIGHAPQSIRRSLQIERVLGAPLVEGALAAAIDLHRAETTARTLPLPKLSA